ncbi:TonB-dependent receptor, partial [Acinetobacter baumannii]|uniref:TonB-dependent receptor n=8 Tax=Pseudomonadota TaxID=1224 RepID=UPI001C09965D
MRTTWILPERIASVSVNWRHRAGMPLDVYAPASTGIPTADPSQRRDQFPGIKAYDWFDLALTFDVTKRMTFRLAANNIFDRDPP